MEAIDYYISIRWMQYIYMHIVSERWKKWEVAGMQKIINIINVGE